MGEKKRPQTDADIPEKFRGDREVVVFEYCAEIAGQLRQLVAVAIGSVNDDRADDETMRRQFARSLLDIGAPATVQKVFRLRGVSDAACEYIRDAMHIVAAPVRSGQQVPVETTLTRPTLISLLTHGSGTMKHR